jgi:hypothetical protein
LFGGVRGRRQRGVDQPGSRLLVHRLPL